MNDKFIIYKLSIIKDILNTVGKISKFNEVEDFVYSEYDYWLSQKNLFTLIETHIGLDYMTEVLRYTSVSNYLTSILYGSLLEYNFQCNNILDFVYLSIALTIIDKEHIDYCGKISKVITKTFDKAKQESGIQCSDNPILFDYIDIYDVQYKILDILPDNDALKLKAKLHIPLNIDIDMKELTSIFFTME